MLNVPYHGDIPDQPSEGIPDEVVKLHRKLYLLEQENQKLAEKARGHGQILTGHAILSARMAHLINYIMGVETEGRLIFEIAFAETVRDSLNVTLNKAQSPQLFIPSKEGIVKPR